RVEIRHSAAKSPGRVLVRTTTLFRRRNRERISWLVGRQDRDRCFPLSARLQRSPADTGRRGCGGTCTDWSSCDSAIDSRPQDLAITGGAQECGMGPGYAARDRRHRCPEGRLVPHLQYLLASRESSGRHERIREPASAGKSAQVEAASSATK